MHGRSQAVRLPKEFRLPGTKVKVTEVGDKVILEPMEKKPSDAKSFWATIEKNDRRNIKNLARRHFQRRASRAAA
jgi:antitoxin VapB